MDFGKSLKQQCIEVAPNIKNVTRNKTVMVAFELFLKASIIRFFAFELQRSKNLFLACSTLFLLEIQMYLTSRTRTDVRRGGYEPNELISHGGLHPAIGVVVITWKFKKEKLGDFLRALVAR